MIVWLIQSFLVFHLGLIMIFVALYYISTGKSMLMSKFWFDKRTGDCVDYLVTGVLGTFLGFLIIIFFNMASAAWVNLTLFQLSFSTTYVSTNAIIARLNEKRKKPSREYLEVH